MHFMLKQQNTFRLGRKVLSFFKKKYPVFWGEGRGSPPPPWLQDQGFYISALAFSAWPTCPGEGGRKPLGWDQRGCPVLASEACTAAEKMGGVEVDVARDSDSRRPGAEPPQGYSLCHLWSSLPPPQS